MAETSLDCKILHTNAPGQEACDTSTEDRYLSDANIYTNIFIENTVYILYVCKGF